jgi:hypothetical protein
MNARSSIYTAEIADHILRELRSGRSLSEVCRDDGMPHHHTVISWVKQDHEGFAARYRQARQDGHVSPCYAGYPVETKERLLAELMNGRPLVDVCADPDMPDHTTINRWVATDRDDFAERYRRAREIGRLHQAAVPYSAEVADRILDELMGGRPLVEICSEPDMPAASSVRHWVKDDRDGFAARYRQARDMGWDTISDQILQIVDDRRNDWIRRRRGDGTTEIILDPQRVNRAKLRVKARCWLLSKRLPKIFGDRADLIAQQQANRDYDSQLAEMYKLIDGRTRGLPSEDEPLDENEF